MHKKLLEISQRPFFRNVAAIASGTALAQAITIAFAPFVTRIYGPDAYGIVGIFMSIAGVMGAIASLAFPVAIVLPKHDSDAFGLVWLSIYIGLGMSSLAAICLFFFGHEILTALNAKEILAYIYLIPIFMIISVLMSVVGQWLIRKKAFALTAKVKVWQALLVGVIKISFGFVWPVAAILVITNVMSGLLGFAMMALGFRRSNSMQGDEAYRVLPPQSYWHLARRYYDFPLFRAPQELLNSVSYNLPIMMLAAYFGAASVGYYSIASAVLGIPVVLIGSAVMQVFYPRITDAVRGGENVKALIVKATIGLALSGAPLFLIVMFFGPAIFELFFGSQWSTAGVYAQWLSLWLFFQYINRPAVAAIPALGLQRGLLIYEFFSTGTKLLALYIGYEIYGSEVAAIALFSIFGSVAYASLILWVILLSGKTMTGKLLRQ